MDALGLATFDEIVKQINLLARLHDKHRANMAPHRTPPSELVLAFQNLRFHLDAAKEDIIGFLKAGLFPSPPFRPFCWREPQNPWSSKTGYTPPWTDHAIKRIMPFFNILFDKDQLHLFGLHTVIDEIGRLIESDTEVSALISPWIAKNLSSLAVVSESIHQLHLFQPWSRKMEDEMEEDITPFRENYKETFKDWVPVIMGINFDGTHVYRYADPSDGKFDYPVHKRRTKQNVEGLRKAEANLDEFWRRFDEHFQSKIGGKSQLGLVAHLLASDRTIQRTPAYTEPDNTKKPNQKDKYVYQPFSALFHDRSKQVAGTFNRASFATKTPKVKTKGTATNLASAESPTHSHQIEAESSPSIPVDKRVDKVFRTLFHSPNSPNQLGEIPWTDFLHAMTSVGFSAEKLHGSAWNFTPTTLDVGVEKSIQFHEPHPSRKIPFVKVRLFGRWLGKSYGWDGDVFRLA